MIHYFLCIVCYTYNALELVNFEAEHYAYKCKCLIVKPLCLSVLCVCLSLYFPIFLFYGLCCLNYKKQGWINHGAKRAMAQGPPP